MRVTLVDNLLLERRGDTFHFDTQPHLGLISLLAVLREQAHEGRLLDPKLSLRRGLVQFDADMYEALAEEILATDPEVVGFTSLGCNFIGTARVAAHVRRREPELPILLGGPHASILDRPILERYQQFDVVVRGEAELTIGPVLDAVSGHRFAGLAGISYRDGREVQHNPDGPAVPDLDVLPPGDYTAYPIEDLDLGVLRVEAGRGCPFACTFCSTATFFGRRYRLHSTERLRNDLLRLNAAYGITHFALTHDLFTVNKGKVLEFCDGVADLGFTWSCSARMDCVDEKLLARMAEAGCRSIYYGVETGSRRMQKVVAKRLDLDLFWPVLAKTSAVGMEATTSFITGYPQETLADQNDTLDLIGAEWSAHPDDVVVQLHLLTPEPGTGLLADHRDALEWDGHVSDFNLPALEHHDAQTMADDPEVFVNHHYYRTVLPRRRNILVTSIHPVLYRLTPPLQRHLLGRYPRHSLAEFFGDLYDWSEANAPDAKPDSDLLVAYAEATWGTADHLTSLLRYMLAATAPERQFITRHFQPLAGSSGRRDAAALMLSPRAALLRNLHDCPRIMAYLAGVGSPEVAEIPAELRRVTSSFVLVPQPRGERIRAVALSPDAAELLNLLRVPSSRLELTQVLGVPETHQAAFDELLDTFLATGVLTEADPALVAAAG